MMRVYQTMGLAFIFIPINTLSYVGMPPNKSNQISGITNLARNIGGSIGISMLSTFLLRLSQKHQVYLVAHAGVSDPAFAQQVAGLTRLSPAREWRRTLRRAGVSDGRPDDRRASQYAGLYRYHFDRSGGGCLPRAPGVFHEEAEARSGPGSRPLISGHMACYYSHMAETA